MAKKKVTKATKVVSRKGTGPGRPKGSKNATYDNIAVVTSYAFSKATHKEQKPGYRRVILATSDQLNAVRLEELSKLITSEDSKLMSLLTPAEYKKRKAKV
jgi:hypothetical protein